MDAKLAGGFLLNVAVGFVGGLAFAFIVPHSGWLILIGPFSVWIGAWWLLAGAFLLVVALTCTALHMLLASRDAAMRYAQAVPKEELEVDPPKQLGRGLDLHSWESPRQRVSDHERSASDGK